MNNFEKKFGKYAIKNISLMLIMCYGVGYLVQMISPSLINYLYLDPYQILRGQVWRLFTWIIIPPSSLNFFTIIMLYFYYSIGTTLERTWGIYRYNVYLIGGMLFTILGSFLAFGAAYFFFGDALSISYVASQHFLKGSSLFSTYYINMSIFLAFAATFPETEVLLMFVIPVKMKWLGIVYGIMLGAQFISGVGSDFYNIFYRFAIAASLFNFIVFYFTSRNPIHMTPKQRKKRQEFKSEVKKAPKVTVHKCAVCGRTSKEDDTLEFRFCSKCEGSYEYCQYHLFTHEHVKK